MSISPITAALIVAWAFAAQAEDLPLPQHAPRAPRVAGPPLEDGTAFLKPTLSIKPPAPVAAALRRIVVMQGPVAKKLERAEVPPQGTAGKSVTLVGIDAPKDVVRGLEGFFGVQLTPDNEKKLLDTVRKGMAGASKQDRKVEVLGWWPKEGVMAVGVYPEG